ncbi:MAG: T9SS type A sorting domain-containing protein, partial [Bacteroidota bacterium]
HFFHLDKNISMPKITLPTLICALLLVFGGREAKAQFISSVVWTDSTSRLYYKIDEAGNKIPDFSHAGYRGGGVEIPQVPTKFSISPVAGDNTAHIQAAIDSLSSLAPDMNGFRGGLLLDTGRYEIHGILRIETGGVILRGSGNEADPSANTVLIGVGNVPNQRTILIAGGGSETVWEGRVPNTATFITTDTVFVGDNQVKVERPDFFTPGDNVVINHPCTNEWLQAIDNGGAVNDGPWTFGSQPLIFNRRIIDITDSVLTLDVPIYNTLNKSLSPSFVYKYDRVGLVREIGIENLRIEIETAGPEDEAHAWNGIGLVQVEDAWVKNCTFLSFGLAGVYTATANRITIDSCEALDPVALITGGRMYNFNFLKGSSQVLVQNCLARNGRHHYVSNGTSSVSGCVFLNCISQGAYNGSEGHRRWSMGMLFDNHRETGVRETDRILLALQNRGDFGTAHGWANAHSVAWNCDMAGAKLVCQRPPTAQNYAIGCKGQVSGNGPWPGDAGFIEATDAQDLQIPSLYEAQLTARLAGLAPVITRVEEDEVLSTWKIYPNPSKGHVNIEAPNQQPFQGIIYNLDGKKMSVFSDLGTWKGDLSHLPEGIYIVQISQGREVHWIKWVKIL